MGSTALRAAALAVGLLAFRPSAAQQDEFIVPAKPLAEARAFHGSAVLGGYLYTFGGSIDPDGTRGQQPEKKTDSVFRAPVLSSGEIGAWEATTPLPQTRHYIANSTLVLDDMVYIVGGSSGADEPTHYKTAIYTRPLPNGSLLPWAESQPFGTGPNGLTTVTAVSTPGHIHVIGGLSGSAPVADVWSNSIYSDGSMGPWFPGPPLPFPLWFHCAGVAMGRVWVWGGMPQYKNDRISPYTLSAPIMGSGKIGPWRVEQSQVPQPFYRAAGSVAGPYLIAISPSYVNGTQSNDLWFAQVTPNGLGAWNRKQTAIPNRVYHATAADYRLGAIFVNGGRIERGKQMLDAMAKFRLTPAAQRIAEEGWMAAQLAHANTVAALPPPSAGSKPAAPSLSYVADKQVRANAIGGFASYSAAREAAARDRKPLVIYFNLDNAAPCNEQKAQLDSEAFRQLLGAASFAWVDTQDYPQLVQQLGVYRVPTWVFYDKAGNEVTAARRVGVQQAADLAGIVAQLR